MAERGEVYREYQRAYYQAHKEELQRRHREYYWKNKEQQRGYNRKHYLANREKIRKAALERYYKLKTERMEKAAEKIGKFPRCPWCGAEMKANKGDVFRTDDNGWMGSLSCNECGANSSFVYGKATKGEAVNALRELKPKEEPNRVLTLGEVLEIVAENKDWYNRVCWLEWGKDSLIYPGCIKEGYTIGDRYLSFEQIICEEADFYSTKEYGEKWRCWLRNPTKQERTETPWEEESDDDD